MIKLIHASFTWDNNNNDMMFFVIVKIHEVSITIIINVNIAVFVIPSEHTDRLQCDQLLMTKQVVPRELSLILHIMADLKK